VVWSSEKWEAAPEPVHPALLHLASVFPLVVPRWLGGAVSYRIVISAPACPGSILATVSRGGR
jgi:hypothetical protein